jgi:hypothetical protein
MGLPKLAVLVFLLVAFASGQFVLAADKTDKNDKTDKPDKTEKSAKSYAGWHIMQTCIYQGEEQVSLCSWGVKVLNPKNGLTTIYATPFKAVIYYDLRTGLMCEIPIEKDDNPYMKTVAIVDGILLSDTPMHKAAESDICGLPAIRYETSDAFAAKQAKLHESRAISGNEALSAEYDVFKNIQIDPLEAKFLSRLYGVPNRGGVPGAFKYKKVSGSSCRHLETNSCKQAKVTEHEFAVPPNLKRADSAQAVLAGSNADMMGL